MYRPWRRSRFKMAQPDIISQIKTPDSAPRYELWVRRHGSIGAEYEIWQVPAIATPQVTTPLRVAGLRGRNLELVGAPRTEVADAIRRQIRASHEYQKVCIYRHGRLGAFSGLAFPHPCPDAKSPKHARSGRGNRGHGARRSRLLARHGGPPQAPAPCACVVTIPFDRSEKMSRMRFNLWLTFAAPL